MEFGIADKDETVGYLMILVARMMIKAIKTGKR